MTENRYIKIIQKLNQQLLDKNLELLVVLSELDELREREEIHETVQGSDNGGVE